MDAFRCDRCKKYGSVADKEILTGTVIKDVIPTPHEDAWRIAGDREYNYKPRVYTDTFDLCAVCAKSLRRVLKMWWTLGETMLSFENIEELVEGFSE